MPLAALPSSSHGTTVAMSGGLRNSSYARTAHALLHHFVHLQGTSIGLNLSHALGPAHPLITHLSNMRNKTLNMVIHIVHSMSLADMNSLRPLTAMNNDGVGLPAQSAWSADSMQLVAKCISAYFECVTRHNNAHTSRADRKLLVVKYTNASLDKASLGRILNEPDIVACIPSHYRYTIGIPLVCYKYSVPIGKLWHNTKHYACLKTS